MTLPLEAAPNSASTDVTPFAIPATLQPVGATAKLPAIGADDLQKIHHAGWARYGIVAAVVDDHGRLLMLNHAQGDKTASGVLGPLAETAHLSTGEGVMHVESTAQTLARGIREELGVDDPVKLGLTARQAGAWALSKWPVGGQYEQQYALAVCPVVYIGQTASEALVSGFTPTDEIQAVQFMSPDEITAARNLRDGTLGWLGDIAASGLLDAPQTGLTTVDLLVPPLAGVGQDVRFDRIEL